MPYIPWMFGRPVGGKEYHWVLHWEDHKEIFSAFEDAKQDLLQELWFFSREFLDADPDFAEEIMAGWSEVLIWKDTQFDDDGSRRRREFVTEIAGFKYTMTRLDEFDEPGQ